MIMKCTPLLFFLLSVVTGWSQDLHIHYDVARDSVAYIRGGKSVPNAEVKRGQQVVIHVQNYNNYLYDVRLEVEKEKIDIAEKTGVASGARSGMGTALSMILGATGSGIGLSKLLPFGGSEQILGMVDRPGSAERKAREAQAAALVSAMDLQFREGARLESLLNGLEEETRLALESVKLAHFAHDELYRIRLDPLLSPDQIRTMAREYALIVFGEADPEKITLEAIRRIPDPRAGLVTLVNDYRLQWQQYRTVILKLDSLQHRIAQYDLPESNLVEVLADADLKKTRMSAKARAVQTNLESLEKAVAEAPGLGPDRLVPLRTLYTALMNNSFSKSYPYEATGETMVFRITLHAIDTSRASSVVEKKLNPVKVSVIGGIRITTSIGLGFSQFFRPPHKYFVRDSIIRSTKKDDFLPQLTSFLHFYYPRASMISWGGSVGVGMPLLGGEGLESISFLIGPSMLIGQKNRVIVTFGLQGGRVARPSSGFDVGDQFPGDPNLFTTESHYQLGYFLSANINLSGS